MVENSLDVGGAVVFWTAAEFTDRERLSQAFRPLGLESYVPDLRPETAVLREALEEVFGGSRTLIRPLAPRDGFAVVQEERGARTNEYRTVLVARVSPHLGLSFEPHDARAQAVVTAFQRHRERIPGVQLSAALVKVVESLGGTRLRPTGAIYWIPGPRLAEWMAVAQAVEGAALDKPSAVYLLRHRFDADAVRAVRDAVVTEVQGEVGRIRSEVETGSLGGRALETRQSQARELRDKVLLYEHLLSVGLSDLHRALDEADQATACAALLLSAHVESAPTSRFSAV